MDIKLENQYCCCCFNNTNLFNMLYPYDSNGTSEIYSNMISECFGLEIKISISDEYKNLYVICKNCITNLRNASHFRLQVENAYNRIRDIVLGHVSTSIKSDPDEIIDMDNDIACVKIEDDDNFKENFLDIPFQNDHINFLPEDNREIGDRELITDKNTNAEVRGEPVTESDSKPLMINKVDDVQKRKIEKKSNADNSSIHMRVHKAVGYTCDICNKTFKLKRYLRQHLMTHQSTSEITENTCGICQKTFKLDKYLRKHMKMHESTAEIAKNTCGICHKTFKWGYYMREHMKIHQSTTENTEYPCEICGKTFKIKRYLKDHMKRHDANCKRAPRTPRTPRVKCKLCKKEYNSLKLLEAHIKNYHSLDMDLEQDEMDCKNAEKPSDQRVKCTLCAEEFDDAYYKNVHLKEVHNVEKLTFARVTPYRCDVCNEEFHFEQLYRRHMESFNHFLMKNNVEPIDPKNIKCGVCGERFTWMQALKHHMGVHFPNCICHICSKPFISLRNLQNHLKTHDDTVRTCDICQRTFTKESVYKQHMLTHRENFKKYKFKCNHCPEEFDYVHQKNVHLVEAHDDRSKMEQCKFCDKTFHTNGKLSAHIRRVHKKIKNYQCDFCNVGFFRRSELENHMPSHTGRRDFHCDKCKSSFKTKLYLHRHKKICKR